MTLRDELEQAEMAACDAYARKLSNRFDFIERVVWLEELADLRGLHPDWTDYMKRGVCCAR